MDNYVDNYVDKVQEILWITFYILWIKYLYKYLGK